MQFCAKEDSTVRQILSYIDWMDRHFPGWDDGPGGDKPPLSEKATRPLRRIKDPELAQKCIKATIKLLETRKDPFTGRFVSRPNSKRMVARAVAKVIKEAARATIMPEDIPVVNIWDYPTCDPRFGIDHPGRIPGQAVAALLWYFAPPGSIIVDPFAGGGTTLDVCRAMNRGYTCYCYDIQPARPEIKQWDIRRGFPSECQPCHLIFLDPPYWDMKDPSYPPGSISRLSYHEFINFMERLAAMCLQALTPGGVAALLIQDKLGRPGDPTYYPTSVDSFNAFRRAGLKPISRILVPLRRTVQEYSLRRYREEKMLLGLARDLWILKKPEEER